MNKFDRLITIAVLAILFFGCTLMLINSYYDQEKNMPRSVMVSPTAAQMAANDPRQRAENIIKLCYSPEKFINDIRKNGVGLDQKLIARGVTKTGEPLEIYASNTLGYGGLFAIYIWERGPDADLEVCRIAHGKNIDLNGVKAKTIPPEKLPLPSTESESVPLPVNPAETPQVEPANQPDVPQEKTLPVRTPVSPKNRTSPEIIIDRVPDDFTPDESVP